MADRKFTDLKMMTELLKEFMDAFGCVQNDTPTIVDPKTAMLCTKLRVSEKSETIEAMADENLVGVLDGLIDQLYVVIYTARAYGLADLLVPAFMMVHDNNMSKLGLDGKPIKDASGKVRKPEGYKPVDLRPLLNTCKKCCLFETIKCAAINPEESVIGCCDFHRLEEG